MTLDALLRSAAEQLDLALTEGQDRFFLDAIAAGADAADLDDFLAEHQDRARRWRDEHLSILRAAHLSRAAAH